MVDDDRGTIQHIRDFAGNPYDIANIFWTCNMSPRTAKNRSFWRLMTANRTHQSVWRHESPANPRSSDDLHLAPGGFSRFGPWPDLSSPCVQTWPACENVPGKPLWFGYHGMCYEQWPNFSISERWWTELWGTCPPVSISPLQISVRPLDPTWSLILRHLVHPSFLSGPTIVIPDPICWSYSWR